MEFLVNGPLTTASTHQKVLWLKVLVVLTWGASHSPNELVRWVLSPRTSEHF